LFHQCFTRCKIRLAAAECRKLFSQNTLRTRIHLPPLVAGRGEGAISRPISDRNSFHINTLELLERLFDP